MYLHLFVIVKVISIAVCFLPKNYIIIYCSEEFYITTIFFMLNVYYHCMYLLLGTQCQESSAPVTGDPRQV